MKRNVIAIAIALGLFGCQNAEKKAEVADAVSINELNKEVADTATSKIIKTADMRFRVKDVQKTKEQLSQTIKSQGGAVAEFSIESAIQETDKVKLSADSLKEITSYRTEGYLIAKVPSEKLDEFTSTIARMAVFVNSSSMKMDDQSIAYLANKMKAQNRVNASNQIIKIPLKKTGNVETALALNDDYVDKKLDNLSIDARVKYSTITLNFYQDNTVKTMVIANDSLSDYRPAFASRLWINIVNGWAMFMELILALSNLWMLFVLGIAGYFVFKFYRVKRA
jgi:hypothetical protein